MTTTPLIEEVQVTVPPPDSDGYVLQAMNQMKEKFDQNEKIVNSIKRKCLTYRNEFMILTGMICCIDDTLHQFDMGDISVEISIMMNLLRGRVCEFVEQKIIMDDSLKMSDDEDYDEPTATVRIIPN